MESHERLKAVVEELLRHMDIFEKEAQISIYVYGLKSGVVTKENLHRIFASCIKARAGPLVPINLRLAINEFDNKLDEIMSCMEDLSKENAAKKYMWLLNKINSISYVGPKIACEFIKSVVYVNKIWPILENELYIPLDRHIHNIIVEKLEAYDRNKMPRVGEKLDSLKFMEFQQYLSKIHTPRIHFDHLWFIGNRFCSGGIYCDLCWIKKWCKKTSN